MAKEAVFRALETLPYDISEIDLIVAASYTPVDTVATLAHYIQKAFNIENTRALYLSTACSSFINAVEVVEGYFASGKASKALIIIAEHNTSYSDDKDTTSGHLWGDGSAALFLSNEACSDQDPRIIAVQTKGLATVGKGPQGVNLKPQKEGLRLPFGKDVYIYACQHMAKEIESILSDNQMHINDVSYIIPHQANVRIIKSVANSLHIDEKKMIINIDKYGNTGSAGAMIALSESRNIINRKNVVAVTVFGGGYSSGAMLIQF